MKPWRHSRIGDKLALALTTQSFNFFWITLGFASVFFFVAWFIRNVMLPWELQREPLPFRRQSGFWAVTRSDLSGFHVKLWSLTQVLLVLSLAIFTLACANAVYMAYLHHLGRPVEWWVSP